MPHYRYRCQEQCLLNVTNYSYQAYFTQWGVKIMPWDPIIKIPLFLQMLWNLIHIIEEIHQHEWPLFWVLRFSEPFPPWHDNVN